MTGARSVLMVVPEGVDDPLRPSGGNTYDRRLCDELSAAGWSVRLGAVPGGWPWPAEEDRRALGELLGGVPDGSLVLVDGLVASTSPELLVPASRRLWLVVLMHMPLGASAGGELARRGEAEVLHAAVAVVTTSEWSRRWLLEGYRLDPARVHVAHPGVDAAEPAAGSEHGRNLLCVGAVIPEKGQDVLVAALARIADLPWRCVCVGTLSRAPTFVAGLRRTIDEAGLSERVVLTGPRTAGSLVMSYAEADLLVLSSLAETYGMVITEALARGLPVVAGAVGGVPEALGVSPDGTLPGMLLPPGDVAALAESMRRWLCDAELRRTLRESARGRRSRLAGWSDTAEQVDRVLVGALR